MKTVFYEGWVGNQNIGDEACFEAIKQLLGDNWNVVPYMEQKSINKPPDLYILGGGTILRACDPSIKQKWPDVPLVVWGSGVEKYGLDQGGKIHPNFYEVVNRAKLIGVRGPISQEFIFKTTGKQVEIIGDPALYLGAKDAVVENAGLKSRIIALNIGDAGQYMYGNINNLIAKTNALVYELTKLNYQVVLFEMWSKDRYILEKITTFPGSFDSSRDLMNYFKKCRFVVGEKLHTSVLAAAAGVPFISLAYREKCLDFVGSMESPAKDWYVRTDDGFDKVIEIIKEIEEEYGNNTLLLQNATTYYRMLQLDFARRVKEI